MPRPRPRPLGEPLICLPPAIVNVSGESRNPLGGGGFVERVVDQLGSQLMRRDDGLRQAETDGVIDGGQALGLTVMRGKDGYGSVSGEL